MGHKREYKMVEATNVSGVIEHALNGGHFFQQCYNPKKPDRTMQWKFLHNSWIMNMCLSVLRYKIKYGDFAYAIPIRKVSYTINQNVKF